MPDIFKWGMEWLSDQMLTQASETVTFARGAETVDLSAVVGATEQSSVREWGVAEDVQYTEFIVKKTDLLLPTSGVVLPQRGDQIVRTIDSSPVTYEVTNGADMACWRNSDQYNDVIRIYTNRMTD